MFSYLLYYACDMLVFLPNRYTSSDSKFSKLSYFVIYVNVFEFVSNLQKYYILQLAAPFCQLDI